MLANYRTPAPVRPQEADALPEWGIELPGPSMIVQSHGVVGQALQPDAGVVRMQFEVEQKFPVADLAAIAAKLAALGAEFSPAREESDRYYAHPARDFAQTDEALRIRRVGPAAQITYKGPKIDALTKTRREIELPLGAGEEVATAWAGLLEAVGFTPAAEVRKLRRTAQVPWQGRSVVASLDEVDGLGTFVELELSADEEGLDAARACIASLAAELDLCASERRSYLELLLGSKLPWA